MRIELALHSYSLVFTYALRPGYGVFDFIDFAASRGFSGVNISLNGPGWRHLSGQSLEHIRSVRRRLEEHDLSLEIDTGGTDPGHLRRILVVAQELGARNLRTYTEHTGTFDLVRERTIADLKAAVVDAAALGVDIVIENHEEFTGSELGEVIAEVNSPFLGAVYDYGNSQTLLEDPILCLEALMPHIRTMHLKDHLMLRPEHSPDGKLSILGVPVGDGALPVVDITRRLVEAGHRRIVLQSVWAYRAPVSRTSPCGNVTLGEGAFRFAEPPFDGCRIVPNVEESVAKDPAGVSALEIAAVDRGLVWLRNALSQAGMEC